MGQDLALKVLLQANNQTGGVLGGFGASLAALLANPAKAAGLGMIGLGAAIVGVGIASSKMAADYDQHMRMVQALTGSNNAAMAQYDTGLKKLAIDAGVTPIKLTDGLYNVLSASYKGAEAMQVLTLATEDSKIGMTTASVATDAFTNVLRAFSVKTQDITRTNGEMLTTVTLGKATFGEYASTIVKAADASVQFHVSMETMNSAWSTMTSSGIHAAQATTDYVQSLKVMNSNIGTVTKSFHKNGIAFDEAKFNAMDYGHKVQYMAAAVEQANEKHVKITGVTLQAAQAISVISNHIKDYNNNLKILSDKQAMAKKTQEAWNITQGGFNQTMDKLHATLDVVMISIGQKLLPVITKFAQQLLPLVSQVGTWLVQSGALNTVADMLGNTLSALATVLGAIVSNGAAFVSFLNGGSLAATGVKIVLGLLLGAALGFVASGIPALVTGFLAWAAAAGAAAIATLTAAAPFILVGVIIAAVVIAIILAVQHWGAITAWLKGVWAAFSSWFMGALHQLGSFFVNVWNGIVGGLRKVWSVIVTVVQIALKILFILIFGQFIAIGLLFIWLYNHNTYFKKLVDTIVSVVKDGVALLVSMWHNTIQWIVDRWNWLKDMATTIFTLVYNAIATKFNQVKAFISSILASIISVFSTQWNNAVRLVTQLWQKISQIFSSAWTNFVKSPLGQLLANLGKFFEALPGMALTWGENLIKGFISGITNMLGAVGSTVANVASKVAGFLGFHSPSKEGPGSTAHTWGPNLMKMFTGGLADGLPALKNTVALLALQLHGLTNPQNTALAIKAGIQNAVTGAGTSVASGSGVSTTTGAGAVPGGTVNGGTTNVYITINAAKATAKEVAAEVITIIDKRYKRSGNHVTVTSGGKA